MQQCKKYPNFVINKKQKTATFAAAKIIGAHDSHPTFQMHTASHGVREIAEVQNGQLHR